MKRTVSVIIPAYNAGRTLRPLLGALKDQTRRPDEVIVVDDCSPDDGAAIAAEMGAKVVRQERNAGPGPARNAGVAQAAGVVVMFTDADCMPPRDWIERALAFMAEHGTPVTTSGYLGPVESNLSSWFQHWEKRAREPFAPAPIAATNGHSLAMEREFYREVGGMPDLRTSEDFLFGLRLCARAAPLFDPRNGVYHRFRPGVGAFFRQKMLFAQNSVISSRAAGYAGARPATFSPWRTLSELALTALALAALPLKPALAAVLVCVRVLPFWMFLARQERRQAPWALFAYSAPMLVVRDVASTLGLVRGVVLAALGRRP